MRIFLDIGAHIGETLQVAQDPKWGFDRVVAFEPAPSCWPVLEKMASDRTEICRFGLWREDSRVTLYNAGDVGASVYADKDPELADAAECQFRDAFVWLSENVRPDDDVYAKINVEGAEAELIGRLAETGTLSLIDHLMIHFDVRKVPSKRHLEARVRAQLDAAGVDYNTAEDILFGVVGRGTARWLRWCTGNPATRDFRYKVIGKRIAAARKAAYPLKQLLVKS